MSQTYENAFLQQSFGLAEASSSPRTPLDADNAAEASRLFRERRPLRVSSVAPPQQYNEDGTENLDWARYQSALRLRTKWESIYDRFKDAHMEDQDEIYLGRVGVEGDEPRIIRDRGSLRSLDKQLWFGSFIRDEDLDALPAQAEDEDPASSSDTDPSHALEHDTRLLRPLREDDPDLQQFLRQEAQRRAVYGDEEPGDVIDLRSACRTPGEGEEARRATIAPPSQLLSSSEVALELDIYRSVKREAVDQLLRTNTLGAAKLPYMIPGLSAMMQAHQLRPTM
ncbi:hypothetical protein MSPP1_000018 [Malassezia sp. CBS 17886]|nr:hypothetical protein MSPP1_000018 [Malassezia sp. CBS 17886]